MVMEIVLKIKLRHCWSKVLYWTSFQHAVSSIQSGFQPRHGTLKSSARHLRKHLGIFASLGSLKAIGWLTALRFLSATLIPRGNMQKLFETNSAIPVLSSTMAWVESLSKFSTIVHNMDFEFPDWSISTFKCVIVMKIAIITTASLLTQKSAPVTVTMDNQVPAAISKIQAVRKTPLPFALASSSHCSGGIT